MKEVEVYGETYSGRALYDILESYVRRAFFSVDAEEQKRERISCGISGRDQIPLCSARTK